jgi:hypothetical protein
MTYKLKQGNCLELMTKIPSGSVSQTMFLNWLQEQPSYRHLWRLEFSFEEIEGGLE